MLVLLLVVPSLSRAALPAAVEPIVLTYEADGACPSRADFVEMVRAYTTEWEAVPADATVTRSIHVRASARPSDATGNLTVTSAKGRPSERHVAAPTCEAVSQALAIMVAVAIDPEALSKKEAPPPAPAPPAPPARPPQDRPPVLARAPQPKQRSRVSIGIRGEVTSAVVDAALPVLALSVEVEPSLFEEGSVPSWLRPSLAAGIRQSFPTELGLRGGSTEFLWTAGNVRLCPVRFSTKGGFLETALCGEANLGGLRARARGFEEAKQSSLLWLDFGASAFTVLALTKHVFLVWNVELIAPYSRRRFELSSGALLSRAPALGLLGGLGAGVRF